MTRKQPFDDAVHQHGRTVLRVCRALLGYTSDADDAWAETFLSALQAWPDLSIEANVEAWLVRIAQRKSIDVIRSRSKRRVLEQHSGMAPASEEHIVLWQAVAELPERQRLAVAYHYLGGLTHIETAELIGGTPAAVRRASADGLKKLRSIYREETP